MHTSNILARRDDHKLGSKLNFDGQGCGPVVMGHSLLIYNITTGDVGGS